MYQYPGKELLEKEITMEGEAQTTLHHLLTAMGDDTFSYEKYRDSRQGEHFVFNQQLLLKYRNGMDQGVLDFWKNYGKGLVKQIHDTDTDTPWVSYTPVSAFLPENKNRLYPYVFQMNRKTDLLAEGYAHPFVCAEEEVILVFPYIYPNAPVKLSLAAEGRKLPNSDLYYEMIQKSFRLLPVDRSRVYLAGFSSPGFRAAAFACEHPELFAGLMLNAFLFPFIWDLPSGDMLEKLKKLHLPIINTTGKCDYGRPVPVYNELHAKTNNGHDHDRTPEEAMTRPNFWFLVNDCAPVTLAQAYATKAFGSDRQAEKEIGLPATKAATVVIDDTNHYFCDFASEDGIVRTRMVAVDNCPHWMHGSFARIQWNFVRHFSRNTETGELNYDGIYEPFEV